MKRIEIIKEKLKIIWHVIKSDRYAFYSVQSGYKNRQETPKKAECFIHDNGDDVFLGAIVCFTERYKNGEYGRPKADNS